MKSVHVPALALVFAAGCGGLALPGQHFPDGGAPGSVVDQDAGPGSGGDAGPAADAGPDGGPAADAGPVSGFYGGHCDAPFPPIYPSNNWRHTTSRELISELAPLHRALDVVTTADRPFTLNGKFAYGPTDKDLQDEWVELWVRRCPDWDFIGVFLTGEDFLTGEGGWARTTLSAGSYPPGDYKVRWVVQGDGTVADGTLAVWRRGMKLLVTDIDGTLTTSDNELFKDVLAGDDADMYPDANTMINALAAKDYRIVYCSGRFAALERYTRKWLADHQFAPGIVRVTSNLLSVAPTESGVQQFKTDFLNDLLQSVQAQYVRAYGNATTDIGAYEAVGVDKEQTYIIGPHAGERNTQPLSGGYTSHLSNVAAIPRAIQP